MKENKLWKKAYSKERADAYDEFIRIGAGPIYDSFLETIAEAVQIMRRQKEMRILDLGAGTGKVTERLLKVFPSCSVTCLDGSPEMLAVAKKRFARNSKVGFVEKDFSRTNWSNGLGKFNAAVSAGAIHHLNARQKKNLFQTIHRLLNPGGVFLCADPLRGDTHFLGNLYEEAWIRQIQRNIRQVQRKTVPLPRILMQHRLTQWSEGDQPSSMDQQLRWLWKAGFEEVDCYWKNFGFAVFGGLKSLNGRRALRVQ